MRGTIQLQYKTLTVPISCSHSDYQYLLQCNKESAKVWNFIIDTEKSFKEENDKKWINQSQLQKATKGVSGLHSKGIQQVCFKYLHARDSALKARKGSGDNNKYPHRKKSYFVTGWDYQSVKIREDHLLLAKPFTFVAGKKKLQKPVKCYIKNIPHNIVLVELIYRDKMYLSIKYKEEASYLQIKSNNHASIDLGEIHAITSIDSCGNAIIITGRKVRAIKQLRNKQQAKLRKKISRTTDGSLKNLKLKRALRSLSYSSERQVLDATHKISKLYVDYCIQNSISTVYYGDLDSATRNIKKRFRGTKVAQKLAQWNYGQLVDMLIIKLGRYGIEMVKVKEYYTSQTCPSCAKRHKPTGRDYACKCGYKQHRDIVGAINILSFNSESKLTHYTNKKYLRIA